VAAPSAFELTGSSLAPLLTIILFIRNKVQRTKRKEYEKIPC